MFSPDAKRCLFGTMCFTVVGLIVPVCSIVKSKQINPIIIKRECSPQLAAKNVYDYFGAGVREIQNSYIELHSSALDRLGKSNHNPYSRVINIAESRG
jgi:hypothetical protein